MMMPLVSLLYLLLGLSIRAIRLVSPIHPSPLLLPCQPTAISRHAPHLIFRHSQLSHVG